VALGLSVLLGGCGGSRDQSRTSTSRTTRASSALAAPATTASKPILPARTVPRPTAARAAAHETTVKLVRSQYGEILADGRGQAFYLFGRDTSNTSQCYGACANRWPPVLAANTPAAGPGAQSGLLGTTRRRDGRLQLTYAGHPMYYYDGDSPGRVLCQNVEEFGGTWRVVRPNGQPVR
jgi:predicted lipoprotein with Yx(FWY)xxD motif